VQTKSFSILTTFLEKYSCSVLFKGSPFFRAQIITRSFRIHVKQFFRIHLPGSRSRNAILSINRGSSEHDAKDKSNQRKHGISFSLAQLAFFDVRRIILEDLDHSDDERRYYCLGKIANEIMTVRFTYRKSKIRIIGAGYWRKGKQIYERENKIHG